MYHAESGIQLNFQYTVYTAADTQQRGRDETALINHTNVILVESTLVYIYWDGLALLSKVSFLQSKLNSCSERVPEKATRMQKLHIINNSAFSTNKDDTRIRKHYTGQKTHKLASATQRRAVAAAARAARLVRRYFNRFMHSFDIKLRLKPHLRMKTGTR
jgi:hypothetical protein